ncbi:Eukaryotic translation initiation factor 3 subunit C [Lamellibrachia satsuma]|nr:Eukaryotic translation initiation factor 3 subunit C [Lamellibrachia satsuma]
MSRFFAAGSDSDSESSSSDEEVPVRPIGISKPMQWSDEEEEVKRVVRSAKDKRFEELKEIIKKTRNHKKIKDMAKILSDFEEMCRAYEKARKVIDKEGATPRFYVRYLAELDDFVNECWEDKVGRKAMSKNNAKGLTALRTKLRKYNRDFELQITEYKEKPDLEDEVSAGSESDEDSEDENGKTENAADMFRKTEPVVSKKPDAKADDAGSDSDDMWYMSSSDSDGSDDNYNKYTGPLTADHFLKKTTAETDEKKKKKEEKRRTAPKVVRTEVIDDEEGDWEEVKGGAAAPMERPKMFSKDAEVTHENVLKKLSEIISVRGKKGTDRSGQLNLLEELRNIAKAKSLGTAMDIKILFHIVASIFDYNPNIATCMKPDMWDKCVESVAELLAILAASGDEIICGSNISEDSETFSGAAPYCIRGCILTMVERMDDEFVKMLQACDAHSTEYIDRLKDETKVCEIINDLQKYLESQLLADEELSPITVEEICRVYLRRIGHLYYKFDYPAVQRDPSEPEDTENDSCFVIDRLCKYIYAKDSTDRIRTRAMLCHVYHHALHDRWFEARDLMLMSHLQDTIQYSDIPTQIMYNRAMVQLGLCAFRQGTIKDSHNCLVDIQSSGRAKELLAQGLLLQRQHERTPEQEKIEKRRQMPYHMHINLELLECVYLVSAMLIEIPYMAAHEFDARRRMISKNFHHVMRMSDKQPLVGPPESMREHVVAASKAMKVGDWNACHNFVINDKMNAKFRMFNEMTTHDMVSERSNYMMQVR